MAITTNTISVVQAPPEGDWKMASLYGANLTGGEDLVAAVAGKCIYVSKIYIANSASANQTVTIGGGEDVATIYIGPIGMPDAGGSTTIDFGPDRAMKVASGSQLSIDAENAVGVSVLVWYKYAA